MNFEIFYTSLIDSFKYRNWGPTGSYPSFGPERPFWSGPALYLKVTEDGEYFWEEENGEQQRN